MHLSQRGVSFVAISRVPQEKLQTFARRMGWRFKWLSSFGNDFNRDYGVSFAPEDLAAGQVTYNYAAQKSSTSELPGASVFFRDSAGDVYHTYSCHARGLDILNGAYHFLDLTPKGRDEAGLPHTTSWVRLRDQFGA